MENGNHEQTKTSRVFALPSSGMDLLIPNNARVPCLSSASLVDGSDASLVIVESYFQKVGGNLPVCRDDPQVATHLSGNAFDGCYSSTARLYKLAPLISL
jgi:hypothetical protein